MGVYVSSWRRVFDHRWIILRGLEEADIVALRTDDQGDFWTLVNWEVVECRLELREFFLEGFSELLFPNAISED